MKINDILSKYSHIRLAKLEDGEAITNFLESIPMKFGSISVRYYFEDSIWKFLNCQGDKSYVFLVTGIHSDDIYGYGVISIRDYFIFGKKHKAGYLSDLRISPKACHTAKLQWKEYLNDIFVNINEIDEFKGVSYFYAAVFENNIKALRLFKNKKFPLIFHPLLKYQAVSILGRKPVKFFKPNRTYLNFTIEKATKKDEQNLKAFLHSQNINKFWGEYFKTPGSNDLDEWCRREKSWDSFNIEDFFIGKNKVGKIVFSTLPWAPKETRKLIIEEIDKFYLFIGKIFKFIGKKELKKNSPLNNYYLTHLEISYGLKYAEKKEIFSEFLNHLYKTNFQRQYHSIIFCDYYDEAINDILNDYIVIKTQAQLYQILSKKNQKNMIDGPGDKILQMAFEAAIM